MKNKAEALYVTATDYQWNNRALPISELQMHEIQKRRPKILCLFVEDPKYPIHKIHFCEFAEFDYNGAEYFIRFSPCGMQPIAQFPGTGMFEAAFCETVIASDYVIVEEILSNTAFESRVMSHPLMQSRSIMSRVEGFSAHLAAKDRTIASQHEELELHRSVLRKDYWLWHDDFDVNHLKSLNCPVMMTAQQVRDLIIEAHRNPHLALEAQE